MKKRLFLIIMIISVVSSSLACMLMTLIYHNIYVSDAKNQLKTVVALTSDMENWADEQSIKTTISKILSSVDYNMRFTLVKNNGEVIYDNWAKTWDVENHRNRPEVMMAFETGKGEYTRYSDTIDSDMYYYAVKINDNVVLRLSREINSINSIFVKTLPILILLFVCLLIIVYTSSYFFTKKLLKPINVITQTLDEILEGEGINEITIYEEFEPLTHKVLEQKTKINQYIEELKYERDTIGVITENMKEGFILVNRDKDILSINTSGKRMIGNVKFDLNKNRNILELTRNNEILEKVDLCISENKHLVYDFERNNNHFRFYFSPVKERDGSSVAGLLILIEDITIQRNAEIMRSEFSANVSHELKTPLTTMIGFAEMIKEGLITDLDSIKKYCGMINKEGLRLISLIEDIMRLSKIEEGINIDSNNLVNLKETAMDTIALLKSKAEKSNIKINLQAENISIKANKNYISELFYNLIDNAIKYNKKNGSVDVIIYKYGNKICIKIKDTGIGISKDHHSRIFERFYRVDKSRSKETGGTGLGLSIVKHITELYEGTIELKSRENIGTEVTIKFVENEINQRNN